MKKIDKKTKMVMMVIIATIIAIVVVLTIITIKARKPKAANELVGRWNAIQQEVNKGEEAVSLIPATDGKYIVISNDRIKICYLDNKKDRCKKVKYTYKDNVMEIADNDFYLSGKQEVLLDGEYMVLKYIANDTDSFELIFKKA